MNFGRYFRLTGAGQTRCSRGRQEEGQLYGANFFRHFGRAPLKTRAQSAFSRTFHLHQFESMIRFQELVRVSERLKRGLVPFCFN